MITHAEAADDCTYWVAIQPSPNIVPNVFGPYTASEANSNRKAWLRAYPTIAKISEVFQAETREQAEVNAIIYIPR